MNEKQKTKPDVKAIVKDREKVVKHDKIVKK